MMALRESTYVGMARCVCPGRGRSYDAGYAVT